MRVSVRHSNSDHGLADAFTSLEDILDLTLKFEEVVLSQLNLFYLQSDGLFHDNFEIHDDFFVIARPVLVQIATAFDYRELKFLFILITFI